MASKRLVVIGGVAAGMSAAAQARRSDPELQITVFEQGEWISYSACGLPYLVGGLVDDPSDLVARTVDGFAKQRIDVKLRHQVTAIDPQHQTVQVTGPDGRTHDEPYDVLMVATGAYSIRPPLEGIDLNGVFNLYRMPDAIAMRRYIEEQRPKRAVIVGGGYIGLEMAENLHRLGIHVQIVERAPKIFANLDDEISEAVAGELERNGVDLSLCDSMLEACAGDRGHVQVVETSHGQIKADLVLLSVGVRPNVALAEAAGVELGLTGAIAVDDHQRTNLPNIYAAGDCAEHYHRILQKPVWVPLGTNANKQGRIAGENIGGGDATFRGILGTAIARVFELEVGLTGLGEQLARREGIEHAAVNIDSTDVAGYFPGASPLHLKLVAERGSGKLVGCQAVGSGVDKRIDVVATALYAGLTADDLAWIDLEYAPPFNSVWDPLHVAARKLAEQIADAGT